MYHRWGASLWLAVALMPCLGCNSGRCTVEGKITFDGVPVEQGTIAFEPADGQGPTTGGRITAGSYQFTGNAAPLPGKKLVRIYAGRKTGRKIPAGTPAPPGTMVEEIKQYIPDIYNTRSTLTCEVLRQNPNRIDFNLKSP